MGQSERNCVRYQIPVSVPNKNGGYFDESLLHIDLPDNWTLGPAKRQQREGCGETHFVFTSAPHREINVVLKVQSVGDALDHSPETLYAVQKKMLTEEYWLRSFKGSFLEKGMPFASDLKARPLFRSRALVSKRPASNFTKLMAGLVRKRPETLWLTECFQFFRFQATVLATGPSADGRELKADYETMLKNLKTALAAFATGRVTALKITKG